MNRVTPTPIADASGLPSGGRRLFLKAGGTALALTSAAAAEAAPRPSGHPRIPNVRLLTHQGKAVSFFDDCVRGRIVVIGMMYTACTRQCPPGTANMIAVRDKLGQRVGRDIHFMSLTLQPDIDTPADLKAYADRYGIRSPGWTFLTGKRDDVELLRRRLGFFDRDPAIDADLSQHSGMLRIGSEPIDRWLMMPALMPAEQIAYQIRTMPV